MWYKFGKYSYCFDGKTAYRDTASMVGITKRKRNNLSGVYQSVFLDSKRRTVSLCNVKEGGIYRTRADSCHLDAHWLQLLSQCSGKA